MTVSIESVLLVAYRYSRINFPWDEDAAGDFVVWLEPAARRLVARWEDRGIPFENAIYRWIKFKSMTFGHKRSTASRQARVAETAASSSEGVLDAERIEPELAKLPAKGKRALYIAALTCPELPDEHLLAIARSAGVSEKSAREARERLADDPRFKDRAEMFRNRRDRAYAQMLDAQWRLRIETEPSARAILAKKERAARTRWMTARSRLNGCRVRPTHAEVGEATGIPKGTIDSSLYWLQRQATA